MAPPRLPTWLLPALLLACSGDDTESTDTGDTGAGDSDLVCDEPQDPPCIDDIILDLSLHDDEVSDGQVSTTADGDDFVTTVDASAGGMSQAANNPWVYVRFTDGGAERVDIDDETALESMEWHIAARRYIVRVNSGDSGPSCVGVKGFPAETYEGLDADPEGIDWAFEDFYDDDCQIREDNSGLPGSPDVALGSWWTYDGCVKTSLDPFYLRLEDGRVIKLVIEAYYGSGQEECNSSGVPGSDSAVYTWRWTPVAP